jgi:hypothetical protein
MALSSEFRHKVHALIKPVNSSSGKSTNPNPNRYPERERVKRSWLAAVPSQQKEEEDINSLTHIGRIGRNIRYKT